MCVCVWVCIYVLPPCGDAFQADLFICSLICQTRSSAQMTFYQDFFSHCLHPSQTCTQIDTQAHSHTAFLSPKHLQSCRCPPASQNSACPPYKVNEFHATAVVTSDYQLEGLYSPILINHNHLLKNTHSETLKSPRMHAKPFPHSNFRNTLVSAFQTPPKNTPAQMHTDIDNTMKASTCSKCTYIDRGPSECTQILFRSKHC